MKLLHPIILCHPKRHKSAEIRRWCVKNYKNLVLEKTVLNACALSVVPDWMVQTAQAHQGRHTSGI